MKPYRPIKKNPSNITAAIRTLDKKATMIEPAEETNQLVNEMTPEQEVLCDCFMRMLANRPIPHCLNISFSVINTLAFGLPKDGRMFIAGCLSKLSESIGNVTDEEIAEFTKNHIKH